jgi:hypothetical protein
MKSLYSLLIALLVLTGTMQAQFPKKIHYQGVIQSPTGPLNGMHALKLTIYDAQTGGSVLSSETQQLQISNGLFSTVLGEFVPLNMPFDRQYWLGISINGAAELTPRTPFTATGYAFMALTVPDTSLSTVKINKSGSKPGQGMIATDKGAKWGDVVTHVYPQPSLYVTQNTGDVTIGVAFGGITEGMLADGAVTAAKFATIGIPLNGQVLTFTNESGGSIRWKFPPSGGFALPFAGTVDHNNPAFDVTNTGNGAAGRFVQSGPSNTPALQVETVGAGSAFSSLTTGTSYAGLFQVNNPVGAVPAVRGENNSIFGMGIEGIATHATGRTTGVIGRSLSNADSARGVFGQVVNAAPGIYASGVRGLSANTTATGYGVWGTHSGRGSGVYGNSTLGVGVRGVSRDSVAVYALHSAATGTNPAIVGETNSAADSSMGIVGRIASTTVGINSSGVYGAISDTNATGNGVWGWHGGLGRGVYGSSNKGVGVLGASADSNGVVGIHTATTGTTAGVRGESRSTAAGASAVLGVMSATNAGATSSGVRGANNNTAANGYGVWGSHAGNGIGVGGTTIGGTGVMGSATSTTATSYGVWGQSASATGTGVYGTATSTTGKNYGVYGQATSDSSSAVYGSNTNTSATAYAGNFKGKVNVSGDITKTYSATSPTAERRAVPICYGTVNANGTIASGTPNFSAAWTAGGDYVIQIEGENYNGTSYTTVVTPISTVPLIGTTYAISNAFLGVRIFNLSSTAIQNGFSFIVYKP